MSIPIELIVQDCFWPSEPAPPTSPEFVQESPIELLTWETWFQQWLELRQTDLPLASGYEITLRLTNDTEIHALNAQYRQKDQATDVLAFAALEVDCPTNPEMDLLLPLYLGDIVISVETAHRQAEAQGHHLKIELAWLAVHGLLHLLGWDHPDEESLTMMLNQQQELLQAIGLSTNN